MAPAATTAASPRDVITDGLRTRHYWLDEHYARIQAALDASLPDHVNVLLSGSADHVLVYSYSDVDPGRWYALDAAHMKMKQIAQRMPSIDPARMQPVQALHYPSFDGTSVPAYLTLPGKPAKPAPLVVLIHGVPQARDHWEFDPEVQILAAHGCVVFQPQFRGSTGFGRRFEEAGYGQWGRAMQDDITGGVHWLTDRKIADPQRICIVAHGEQDGRVPISHGKRMRDALQDLHKDVQWLYFPHAGHGLRLAEEQAEYDDAVFALLARTIGKGEPPFPASAPLPAAAAQATP